MKAGKKILSLWLIVVMILILGVTVFADGNYSITIKNDVEGYTYEAYQIFAGNLYDNKLLNIEWGSGVTEDGQKALLSFDKTAGEEPYSSPAELAESLTETNIKDFAKEAVKYLTESASASTNTVSDGKYLISGLAAGYYLVKNSAVPTADDNHAYYTDYILKVVGDVNVEPKGDVPVVEKKIVEEVSDGNGGSTQSKVDHSDASIGDTIDYEITGKLPTNFNDYKEYYYVFTDTLSKGLTYTENSVKVIVKNGDTDIDVTKYFYVNATKYDKDKGTTLTVGIQDLKALNNLESFKDNKLTKDSQIVVTYFATLNQNAEVAGDGNKNDVYLKYYNDPNGSGDGTTTPPPENPEKPEPNHPIGETPKSEVYTYTTELTILKTDENSHVLTGAEFTLSGNQVKIVLVTEEVFEENEEGEYWKLADGTYTTTEPTVGGDNDNSSDYDDINIKYAKDIKIIPKGEGQTETTVVGKVDEKGSVTFTGLGAGDYIITETKTPAGYNTIEPINFKLTFVYENEAWKFKSDNKDIVVQTDNKLKTTIVNKSGSELPSTGGMGTTLFYIIGGILVVGAVVLLIVKKRMNAEE